MAQQNLQAQSIYNLSGVLNLDNIFPIYFFFGEDLFTIDQAVKEVIKTCEPLIDSDFDKETISVEKKQSVGGLLDIASAFPFGADKKLLIVKNFENFSDKKSFAGYVDDPVDSTVMVITNIGKINDLSKSPFSNLLKRGFIFEAKELKGAELAKWVVNEAKSEKLSISQSNAQTLIEIVGEEKSLLEMQIQKFRDFLSGSGEITADVIENLASNTKEYTIFNLQDAIGAGNKSKALEIAYNLTDNGTEVIFILNMLTRYFTTITQSLELAHFRVPDNEAAREAGVSYFYYKNCRKAKYFLNHNRLANAAEALLNADIAVKSSNASNKSILTTFITQLFTDN